MLFIERQNKKYYPQHRGSLQYADTWKFKLYPYPSLKSYFAFFLEKPYICRTESAAKSVQ